MATRTKRFKRVVKFIGAWDVEKEEDWLRDMARQGWELVRYSFPTYTFVRAEPADYVYKWDYKATVNSDLDEYLGLFADAGWEHVTEFMGWHCFRTLAGNGETPEIYSDKVSKAQRLRGVQRVLFIASICVIPMLINLVVSYDLGEGGTAVTITRAGYLLLLGLLGYAHYRLYMRIRELETGL